MLGVYFDDLPWRGKSEKLKKRGGSMVQGRVFLKGGGGGGVTLFLFNFFKGFHFYINKLVYPLQNCVIHLKKTYFFLPP